MVLVFVSGYKLEFGGMWCFLFGYDLGSGASFVWSQTFWIPLWLQYGAEFEFRFKGDFVFGF